MTIQELQDRGAIYFDKINSAFDRFDHVKLPLDEKKAVNHFKNLKKEYGEANSFADFYYFRLEEESREMVEEELTPAELSWLKMLGSSIEDPEEDIIFQLDDTLLRIICKLNAKEILFSTIYFVGSANTRPRTTWWGNYEKEYVCFRDKKA